MALTSGSPSALPRLRLPEYLAENRCRTYMEARLTNNEMQYIHYIDVK